jgi:hypothetical protein
MRNALFCALLVFGSILGCAAPVPPAAPQQQQQADTKQADTKPADIRGTVTRVAADEIRVEADPKTFSGAKAVVKITSTTEISDASGKTVAASALREGQVVRVWYGGAVALSYPLQTEAVKIVIE